MTTKKILLLRHGQTDWNAQMRFQGCTDIPLNELGMRQAAMTAERIAEWAPEEIYVSPLKRALTTAAIAADCKQSDLHIMGDLREICFGDWEGQSVSSLQKNNEDYSHWAAHPFSVKIPHAELADEIKIRVRRVLDALRKAKGRRILVVSHGGTLRAFLSEALNLSLETVWKNFRMNNCALTGLEDTGEKFVLCFYNDTLHSVVSPSETFRKSLPIRF